jgi:putative nucleotidyltransferase with HDIG domain
MVFSKQLTPEEIRILLRIQEFVRAAHAHSESHDYSHVLTVCRYSIQIAKEIPEPVDPFVVCTAAILHDIGKTTSIFSHLHGLLGGALAEEYLDGLKIDPELRDIICRIVIRHTPTSMIPPETVEEKIIYDADTLDRLGLIGLLRGFIGKSGSMPEIIRKYNKTRLDDFSKLHFDVSKRIGDAKNEELSAYIEIVENQLASRLTAIESLFEHENLV